MRHRRDRVRSESKAFVETDIEGFRIWERCYSKGRRRNWRYISNTVDRKGLVNDCKESWFYLIRKLVVVVPIKKGIVRDRLFDGLRRQINTLTCSRQIATVEAYFRNYPWQTFWESFYFLLLLYYSHYWTGGD